MDLGSVLRQARLEAGLTQDALARSVGVTRQALCKWEGGARPVRSDDADKLLAACGRDVRIVLVARHADVDDELERLAAMSAVQRVRAVPGVLSLSLLHALQDTGAVVFTAAWAAAALGLPALHDRGGMLVSADLDAQARVAAVLKPWSPVSLVAGEAWGITWDREAFVRNPSMTLRASLLGELSVAVAAAPSLELRVLVEERAWRIVDPAVLVPEHVDADALDRWRARGAT